jgi:hypothetical protein
MHQDVYIPSCRFVSSFFLLRQWKNWGMWLICFKLASKTGSWLLSQYGHLFEQLGISWKEEWVSKVTSLPNTYHLAFSRKHMILDSVDRVPARGSCKSTFYRSTALLTPPATRDFEHPHSIVCPLSLSNLVTKDACQVTNNPLVVKSPYWYHLLVASPIVASISAWM